MLPATPDHLALHAQLRQMRLSAIIATKNRAATLSGTLETILRQTVPVDDLVIVDQSADASTRDLIARFARDLRTADAALPEVIYLYDPTLSGAGAARNAGIERAGGDLLIFLDDDVLLEENFFEQLAAAYEGNPELGGVQGIITNYSRPPLRGRLLEEFFFIGPFRDERMPIYWNAEHLRHQSPIPVRKFTSCLMSVKRSALGPDRFDADYNGRGEDIDLSWRVSERYPLVIAPAARARHLRTPLARSPESWLTASLLGYCYLYHRIWNTSVANRLCFAWLKCGFALVALVSSIRKRSIAPWSAFMAAIRNAHNARYV
ncbi:MAG: glycosyltransferase family 2 protein [Acidobacteriia bacterium]|nr:glycosyltransferase family 2 protein [Terriglobia bacterium]